MTTLHSPFDRRGRDLPPARVGLTLPFEVVFTSAASLVLLVLIVFGFVGLPPGYAYAHPDIKGISVLDSMWVADSTYYTA